MFGRGKKARNKAIAVIGVIVLVALVGVAYKVGYLAELGLAQAYYNEVENYKGYTIKMRWVSDCNSCGNAYYVKGYGNGKRDPRWGNVQGARDYIDDVLIPQTTPTPIATPISEGTIIVWSYPSGAKVYVDTVDKGTTGSEWLSIGMEAGRHQVAVSKSGYKTFTEYVTVVAGEQAKVEALLNTVERASPTETPSSKVEETTKYECPEGYEPNVDNTACIKPKASLPGFEAVLAIAGIVTVAYITLKSERNRGDIDGKE